MKLSLQCAIVGQTGSSFDVEIDDGEKVSKLKEAIRTKKHLTITCEADQLQLFLAKQPVEDDGGKEVVPVYQEKMKRKIFKWLPDEHRAALNLVKAESDDYINALTAGEQILASKTIATWLYTKNKMELPSNDQIHVLVVVPGIITTIEVDEIPDKERKDELEYYQRIGQEIQTKCQQHCGPILDKIDAIYEKRPHPMPFICVQGSSGMGKSQLAFALGGEGREHPRPWFYWSLGSAAVFDQLVYKNFSSIAKTFETVVRKDKLDDREEEDAFLACGSPVYTEDKLWTYGFIIELLRYCSRSSIGAQMVRFEKQTFKVTKSTQKDVIKVRSRMEENGEVLPFFILDEMTPSRNKRLSAFQLNVFRACGLVVIGMGTDANISNLTSKPRHSRSSPCWWMTAVTSFPPYQSIPFGDPAKEEAWKTAIQLDGVVELIAKNSRGLFSRYFVDAVVDFVAENETLKLTDLLDSAFEVVRKKTQEAKASMMEPEEPFMYAQLMALSYTHSTAEAFNQEIRGGGATSERSLKKRTAEAFSQEIPGGDATIEHPSKKRKVSVESMQVHFANLEDENITDVDVCGGELYRRSTEVGWGPACHFPAIAQDVLLYLAVLGGKQSAYCHHNKMEYSTVYAFENFRSQERQPHDNINSLSNGGDEFENLVAHALFCASRRHGVGGIPFQEFFSALLGEFHRERFAPVQFDVQELLRQYDGLWRKFAGADSMKIPFLAPPNAIWPDYILTAGGDCNFGHLFRAKKQERLDLYVTAPRPDSQGVIQAGFPLFVCECKNWKNRLDSGAMRNIIAGLNADTAQGMPKWNKWDILLLFCNEITQFQTEVTDNWEYPGTGIVTVACKTGEVNWIVGENGGEKLVIVLLTGGVLSDSVVE